MKKATKSLRESLNVTPEEKALARISFEISNRIDFLMHEKGLSKKQFAEAIGKCPSEVTRWLSGEHNFTIATLGMLAKFFGQPIVTVYFENE